MRGIFLGLIAALSIESAKASIIAVVDSGLDIEHEAIVDHVWTNPVDDTMDRRDDDRNGYVDDIHGWNFFEQNASLLDAGFEDLLNDDVERYFRLQSKGIQGLLSKEDKLWMSQKLSQKDFASRLQLFGNYAHGTHVSGIALQQNSEAKILTIRLIPVKNPLADMRQQVQQALIEGKDINFILKFIIRGGLALFAKIQAIPFQQIGKYIDYHQVDVVNASIGSSSSQIKLLIKPILEMIAQGPVKKELLDDLAIYYLNKLVAEQASFPKAAKDTLFVFAAGNESSNNDEYPTAPANIKADNTISVGASLAAVPAPFSNFGMNVDLLAPGVAAEGPIPGGQYLAFSGTSQAAPMVSGVASKIKDINPELSPAQIKAIILGTVDKKEHLANVVASSGILNRERAMTAAQATLEMNVARAITYATKKIYDDTITNSQLIERSHFPEIYQLGLH